MSMATGNILRVACVQKWKVVNDIVNVFHFRLDTLPTPATTPALLEDIAIQVGSAWDLVGGALSNNVEADYISVYNVTLDAPMGITDYGGTYTGGRVTSDAIPPNDAALILLDTGIKRRQGKIYVGVIPENQQVDGFIGTSLQVALGTFVTALSDGSANPNGTEMTFGVYSRKHSAFTEPTIVRVQRQIARMGSRKEGRGS